MRTDTPARKSGPPSAPRAALRPAFLFAVEESRIPNWQKASLAGFRHAQTFSRLLHMPTVPLSYRPLLERVALLIGYPSDQLFVEQDAAPRLVKTRTDDATPDARGVA